jgi:hypothetical protein
MMDLSSNWHSFQKGEKSCELHYVDSIDFSLRLIHGACPTDVCKLAVGTFVPTIVRGRL